MAGLVQPEAGAILWDDLAPDKETEQHYARLHYVGHLDVVKPHLSVAENLALWVSLRGGGADEVAAGLKAFGLSRLADIAGRFLSAGQRRRLALSRLGATRVPLWLLDEPTVAIDTESVAALMAAIAAHRARGGIAVIATNVDIVIDGARMLELSRFTAEISAS